MKKFIIILLLGLVSFQGGCKQELCFNCWAEELPKEQVIRAMIGEASNQGFDGLYAISCAIKNRGTLKDVYGANAKHIESEPSWVWKLASRAYHASLSGIDVTNGATHWGSKIVDKGWIEKMEKSDRYIKVYELKDHIFYKEVK